MLYLYTDGSVSRPREGKSPGGWAFSYVHGKKFRQRSGGTLYTTGNQMEMMAVIKGFEDLLDKGYEGESIVVVSDSQYVIEGSSRWVLNWKRNGWVNARNKKIKNKDLWIRIDDLAVKFKTKWKWVRGHSGNPSNEAVDKLARAAAFRAASLQGLTATLSDT